MRKDIVAFGVAIPLVAIVVLSLNKGKAVSVAPTAKQQEQAAASQNTKEMKSMESLCRSLLGKEKSKLSSKIGKPYATASGISYYTAASAGVKPPYALALTFKKNKVASAKLVTYGQ